jgi:hypothetical protein
LEKLKEKIILLGRQDGCAYDAPEIKAKSLALRPRAVVRLHRRMPTPRKSGLSISSMRSARSLQRC